MTVTTQAPLGKGVLLIFRACQSHSGGESVCRGLGGVAPGFFVLLEPLAVLQNQTAEPQWAAGQKYCSWVSVAFHLAAWHCLSFEGWVPRSLQLIPMALPGRRHCPIGEDAVRTVLCIPRRGLFFFSDGRGVFYGPCYDVIVRCHVQVGVLAGEETSCIVL